MFTASTFDTNLGIQDTIVYDKNGTIDANGHFSGNPHLYGYVPIITMGSIFDGLSTVGYDVDFNDLMARYGDSTFHSGINSAFTAYGTTTYYMDNGIEGSSTSDVIVDYAGDNIVSADAGDDLVVVGFGNDAVDGGSGNDEIYTRTGDDIVSAGDGEDLVYLGRGDDLARGGRDNDQLYGEDGNDKLWGQKGHDLLDGGAGDDKLVGGGGRDELYGGEGNDFLKGGGGRDFLSGGEGTDILFGGNGRDTFGYSLGDDDDTITDFDLVKDKIEIDLDLGVSSFTGVMAHANQVGLDTVIDFGNGDILTLENIQVSDLSSNDFTFI